MLVALGILLVILLIYMFWLYQQPSFEQFTDLKIDAEPQVINAYNDLLGRQPTPSELARDATQLRVGLISVNGLYQRLIDSDEYSRIIKLQSNELAPELRKMTYEKRTLTHISDMFMEITGKPVNPKLMLPLRDIFIYLEYNEIAMRLALQSPKWAQFEEDMLNAFQLNKEEVIDMFEKTFNKAFLLDTALKQATTKEQVSSIQDPPPEVAAKPVLTMPQSDKTVASLNDPTLLLVERFNNEITGASTSLKRGMRNVANVDDTLHEGFDNAEYPTLKAASIGPKPSKDVKSLAPINGSVHHQDADNSVMFDTIQKTAKKVFDKDEAAKVLDTLPQI